MIPFVRAFSGVLTRGRGGVPGGLIFVSRSFLPVCEFPLKGEAGSSLAGDLLSNERLFT